MKKNKKIIIGLVIVLVCLVLIKKGIFNIVFNSENYSQNKIIQARLVDSGNLNYVEIAGYYEGILTFRNLGDGELHTYNVCLRDLFSVKLNSIYDLPLNYYIPHGGPNESMMTNGCNFSLNLSNKQY